ncbi:MAG: HlyD family efflux transporter periplasmic adaptor subunit [Parvularculaceae bacterium]|nr:HlyD family efflux transporter periplasmic adaptor subunit [Parvularculaceae bacterium]
MKRALIVCLFFLAACAQEAARPLTGYVEADLLYLAPQETGIISELMVEPGVRVVAGDVIFRLDARRAAFSAEQAGAAAKGAEARAADGGMIAQQIAEAEANVALARQTFARTSKLLKEGVITRARYDADAAALKAAEARLASISAERGAALRDFDAATAAASLAGRRLAEMETIAPASGVIERVYRRKGEVVAAGEPVAALLAPENLKIRFFASETMLSSLKIGGRVTFTCDGCAAESDATIVYIASDPQFTPPVIYSLEEREKLVFLVEARPAAPGALRPGQPVSIVTIAKANP